MYLSDECPKAEFDNNCVVPRRRWLELILLLGFITTNKKTNEAVANEATKNSMAPGL